MRGTRLCKGVRRTVLAFVGLAFGACAAPDEGDGPTGEQSCAECEIRMTQLADLGDSRDSASVSSDAVREGCAVARMPNGEYWMSAPVGGGQIFVYPPDGGGAVRAIGRRGEGPREFGRDLRIASPRSGRESVSGAYVLDGANGRLVSLDPATGTASGTIALGFRTGRWAVMEDGRVVLQARASAPGDALFRILDPASEEIGLSIGEADGDLIELDQWVVSPARTGGFWAASIWDYRIYHWTQGEGLQPLEGEYGGWFESHGEWGEDTYVTEPPPMTFQHVWEDDNGLLWTYSVVPEESWTPQPSRALPPDWVRATFDTVVEVLDPNHGAVLATRRFDRWLAPTCGSPLMYTVVETDTGDTRLRVLRPTLMR